MATTTAVPKTRIPGGSFLLEDRPTSEVFTPEDFNEQHQLIAQTADDFATNEVLPVAERMERKDWALTRELLKKTAELGLTSVDIPEEYGGAEMDKVSSCILADHMAKYAGFAVSWGGHTGIGTLPIVFFG
ncbi:MAG TPA: acyl-CoA dehydrogenase family protein, partial [Terriglobales bacterium]|nr:acyl-CoA dehydrogenase family protein [Terriglobales bacterium]